MRPFAWLLIFLVPCGCQSGPTPEDYSDVPPPEWKLEIFLGSGFLEKQGATLAGPMSLDIRGRVLVGTGDNLFDVGSRKLLLSTPHAGLESFTFTTDGGVLTACHGKLGLLSSGEISERVRLPGQNMRLARGSEGRVYLYGARSIYVLAKGGKYSKLLDATDPVTALTEAGGKVFFAGDNVLYLLGQSPKPLLAMPFGSSITSVAVDSGDGTIYFTWSGDLYTAQGRASSEELKIQLVGKDVGSEVHVHDGQVYVLNKDKGVILHANPSGD